MPPRIPLSPVLKFVRSQGEYLTLSEVARTLRIPLETLRSWRSADPATFNATEIGHFGDMAVHLYSPDDLTRVREAAIERYSPRGRPRLWSVAEGADRRRRQVLARQQEVMAGRWAARGDERAARAALARARHLRLDLRREARIRRVRLGLGAGG